MATTLTYQDYCTILDEYNALSEHTIITEGLVDQISGIKGEIGKFLVKVKNELATIVNEIKIPFSALIKAFKNRELFNVLKHFGFSLIGMIKAVQKGALAFQRGYVKLFVELYKTKVFQKIKSGAMTVDELLNKYPLLKKATGPLVAGMLLWVWLNISFIGNFDYDFDISAMFDAIRGDFNLYELFLSPSGLAMLAFVATNMASGGVLSVSWLGATSLNFSMALTYTAVKKSGLDNKVLKQKILSKTNLQEQNTMSSKYEIYHNTMAGAFREVEKALAERGFEIDPDSYQDRVASGPRKPSEGKTNRYRLELTKNGVPVKQNAQVQIYNTGTKYELNLYVESKKPQLTLKRFMSEQEIISTITEIIILSEDAVLTEGVLDEGKLEDLLKKTGLHIHKGKGLIQYLKSASIGVAKLFMAALKGNKEEIKSIVSSIDKKEVLDFLLRLDMATLHLVTGPIHIIDAVTGWHIWAEIEHKAKGAGADLIATLKKAIQTVKTHITNVIQNPARASRYTKVLDRLETEIPA